MECLLERTDCVKFEIVSAYNGSDGDNRTEQLELVDFPKRPKKASRVRITIRFTDAKTGKVTVEDLGLGQFYESSGMKWEKSFALNPSGS